MKLKPLTKPDKDPCQTGKLTPVILKRILATTDFSKESEVGIHHAVALAEKLKAAVNVLYVVEPTGWLSGMEAVVLAADDSAVVAWARAQVAKLAKREAKDDVAVATTVRTGKAFHEITTEAREGTADLIVIATHGYTGVERVLLGSTAESVVRHAPCPVLTVPVREPAESSGRKSTFKLKRILVPIDFSPLSKAALPYAFFLARHFGADIVLVHIVEKYPLDYMMGRVRSDETILPLIKQAEPHLKQIAEELGKAERVKATALVRQGRPFEEICAAAKDRNADIIVLTTHGYTGLKHVWLGSTAERVVRHAPCSVLVVRELEHQVI